MNESDYEAQRIERGSSNPFVQGVLRGVVGAPQLHALPDSRNAPGGPVAEEFVLTDLQDARAALEEVTGKRTSDDLLRHIFSRFCIGK